MCCVIFGRNETTIATMGKNVASKAIVMAEALQSFDWVVVELQNPGPGTPAGKLALAQQLMQFLPGMTREQVMQVATSGTLGPVVDATRELQYELESENEWLMVPEQVMVMS